jgi:pimeloyl-ACP methyl ester carboxylesterase
MNRKMSKHLAVLATVTAGMTLAAGSASAATEHRPAQKPTIVLVHGAFADSSGWNDVIRDLKGDGYPVIAAANPLRDLQSDAAYVRSVVDGVSGPVVLAGHSYGGSVISEAAEDDRDVKALVYIASFTLDVGESTSALAGKFPGNQLPPALNQVPFPAPGGGTGTDLSIKQDKFREVFAADVPRETTELMAVTQRPVAVAALDANATKAAWKTIPSWTMITTQDLAIPPKAQRFMAERAKSHTVEVKASHAVAVSRPQAVADLIDKAARATNN